MAPSPFSLAGKLALITGSASGIGAGIALALAEAGAKVIIADILGEAAEAKASALLTAGFEADWIALDVSDEASVNSACTEIIRRHGAPWIVVNNAGLQNRQYINDETVEGWDRMLAVNSRGPFLVTRALAREMVGSGNGGRIINIASGVLAGMLTKGTAAYTASKGALEAFSRIAALEYAEHKITVNTVLPGAVATPGAISAKGPPTDGPGTRRAIFGLCDAKDIGHAVLFFASPGAGMITNQVLSVDGGFSVS